MKPFLDEHFLLQTETAKYLYHEHAKNMPIIDYHNHLPPIEIAENRIFENFSQVWLHGDHYKWRAMRTNGIDEEYITGHRTSDWQKFEKWAETVPYTMRNPLYHWTHLELQRYFGISKLLSPSNAREIYDEVNERLKSPEYFAQGLLTQMKVEIVCTTDDPVDLLEQHLAFKNQIPVSPMAESTLIDAFARFQMLPTFRADKAMAVENPNTYKAYLKHLGEIAGVDIISLSHLMQAITRRHDFFEFVGCKLSDHGLETIYASDFKERDVETSFQKLLRGVPLDAKEILDFKSFMLYHLAVLDASKGWTQQFHIGAIRNNSNRLMQLIGADCGADSIGDFEVSRSMAKFFNRLDSEGKLAKTIIYNLNPALNDVYATMVGNFQDGSMAGKIQFGSGWWFLDQKEGMERQLNSLSNMGLLSRFIGMLTDSRSFLSFPRHEYFRRILCNLIGNDVEHGELPNDTKWLGQMVENISYYNAKEYFKF